MCTELESEAERLLDVIDRKTTRLRSLPADITSSSKIFDLVSDQIEMLSRNGYSYANTLSYINHLFGNRFEKTSLITLWSRYRRVKNEK